MTRKIKQWADHFGASIHPVNPNRDEVYGLPCHASIDDVDGDIDLAVILTGNAIEAFESMLDKKPRFAVIFAAGFAEAGADGEVQQARLERDRRTARTPACSDRTPTSTRSRRSATTCRASGSR